MKKITYFAFAKNKKGKLEQLRVVRPVGLPTSQRWTGKIYKSIKEANADARTSAGNTCQQLSSPDPGR